MRKILLLLAAAALYGAPAFSQITLSHGDNIVEIGGVLSSYLNFRNIKADAANQNKNKDRFKLRDARLKIEGRSGNTFEYKMQVDFANLGTTNIDPESPPLYDAYIKYKGFSLFNITAGYTNLPYSRSSLVPFSKSPYWQRAEITRGELFSRRDIGITLDKSVWKQRINMYAGVYNGTGEVALTGDNDASGAFEYIGRVDVSYPSRYRYEEVDTKVSPIPMFTIGVNGRYTKRELPDGENFINGETGAYGLKVVNGKKVTLGMDASVQYQGLSFQFETHQIKGTPKNASDELLKGLPASKTQGYFKAGGWIAQANYFLKPLKLILSARYDQLDLNDLVPGHSRHFSAAAAYQVRGYASMIKAQFFQNIEDESTDLQRWKTQFRIGWQFALE